MASVKRILCLTNSRKPGGTCFAGRILAGEGVVGAWIRPIGRRESEAVSEREQQLANDRIAHPLDVIDVPVLGVKPHACQTENWLIDDSRPWAMVRQATSSELASCIENPTSIWLNGHSTRNGYHDEMPRVAADQLTNSLVMVKAPSVRLRVFAPGQEFGNSARRIQGFFVHNRVKYGIRVTDIQVEEEFLKREDGIYELGASCITVSISEPFRKSNGVDYRYKLIAAIIPWTGKEDRRQ